tara:strand:- start:3178 stop:4272 length:1095 start_codon:yes stop_codon:yes gene_type:complete
MDYSKLSNEELLKLKKQYQAETIRFDKIQHAKKIQLNCAYGALGNEFFRFYHADYAEAVTTGGQLSIRWIENRLNKFLQKKLKAPGHDFVIASDTDSVYLRLDKLIDKIFKEEDTTEEKVGYLDKFCSKVLEDFIAEQYEELSEHVNAFQQKMFMKREAISDVAIWTGKKHYLMNVHNNEGVAYTEPHLKLVGIEAVKSSTPSLCRQAIKDGIHIIMNGDEDKMMDFIADFKTKFQNSSIEDISFPRGISNLKKYDSGEFDWQSGGNKPPIHVRGSLVFNKLLNVLKIKNYEKIHDGDKIKFCYLKPQNPIGENVISFKDGIPDKIDIGKYIDYEVQFQKSFLEPMRSITEVINWELERRNTLF